MATTSPAKTIIAPKRRNLRTDPKRMAVSKVWNSMMHGADTLVNVTSACESTDLVNHKNIS